MTPTATLIRTRRRPLRQAPAPTAGTAGLVARVRDALAANEPPMVAVADWGRGWWVVDTSGEQVTVRRHGETLTVPWSSVELDA